jgi:hypothetical protein
MRMINEDDESYVAMVFHVDLRLTRQGHTPRITGVTQVSVFW